MILKATSFATRQDLAAFSKAVTEGKTVQQALEVGDNGVGMGGASTWNPSSTPPIVAMPAPMPMGTMVKVTMQSETVQCIVQDRSPEGIVDLSPSALVAFGLDPDSELLSTANVEFLD